MPLDLKPLTALRFWAAMWVVGFHYTPLLVGSQVPTLISKGYLGVELFFVLSGFILSHVYLQAFGEKRFNYGGFLWARIARVYPMHLATLAAVGLMAAAATVAGVAMQHQIADLALLPAQLGMLHAWGVVNAAGWNHPSWSISAEWFAYLCFPAFAACAWRLRDRPRLAVGLAIGLICGLYAAFAYMAGFPLTLATYAWGALRIVPCFAYGAAIYLLWRSNAINEQRLAKIGVFGFTVIILWLADRGAADSALTCAFGGLILCLASLTSTGSKLFSNRVGVYLGEISYAVYMVCFPWELLSTNLMQKVLGVGDILPPALWLVLFFGVIPVAAVAHHLVERPARVFLRRFADRRAPTPIAA